MNNRHEKIVPDILTSSLWQGVYFSKGIEMYNGKCPTCGASFKGWALGNPKLRTCPRCANVLRISRDNDYSTFVHGTSEPSENDQESHPV